MSKYKVAVGINYYDDPKGLIRILSDETLYDYVSTFYVIDGRYAQRYDLPENDPDFTLDLKSIYSKMHLVQMSNVTQIEKRNTYFDLAVENNEDFLIVCDSDEFIRIDPDTLDSSLRTTMDRQARCYPILQYMDGVTNQPRPRLFKAPFNYRHIDSQRDCISHGSLWDENGKEVIAEMYYWFQDHPKRDKNGGLTGIPGIAMWHDKEYRSRERVIADRVYYDEVKNR